MSTSTVARVAATLLTLFAYAAAVSLPAVLLWFAWHGAAPIMLELDKAMPAVQP